jgi:hypothetical protein
MPHLDPTANLDTLPIVPVADVDTAAEGTDTWLIIFDGDRLARISLANLVTVIDTLMEEAGEVHSHA